MSLYYLLLLALVQGLTEFLPVSSSAHLVLLHDYVGTAENDLALDIAVHVGTLGAVTLYFWTEVRQAITGVFHIMKGNLSTFEARLAICLVIATIPVVILGLVFKLTGLVDSLRSITVIGWTMILFGILLWWMDRNRGTGKAIENWSTRDAVIMGLWQALALIPGTSRSGAAITGALAQGYERGAGARIAMLMSIPTIAASGVLLGGDVIGSGDWVLGREVLIATALAFGSGLLALAVMMRLLKTVSFTPYVIYRVVLGLILLAIAYS